jgi:flagellar hook-basal body complex protein FliE
MLEVSKAGVSFKALSEVRNRLVSAYQDIMNMQM